MAFLSACFYFLTSLFPPLHAPRLPSHSFPFILALRPTARRLQPNLLPAQVVHPVIFLDEQEVVEESSPTDDTLTVLRARKACGAGPESRMHGNQLLSLKRSSEFVCLFVCLFVFFPLLRRSRNADEKVISAYF